MREREEKKSGRGRERRKIHIVKGRDRAELIRVTQFRSLPRTAPCSKQHSDSNQVSTTCMRVFTTGGAHMYRQDTSKRSWREILAWRNHLSPTTHTRSYAAVPGDGSFFILALHRNGFCLVLSRLPFLVSFVSPSRLFSP